LECCEGGAKENSEKKEPIRRSLRSSKSVDLITEFYNHEQYIGNDQGIKHSRQIQTPQ
jgi:hypothetical protein